VERRAGNEFVRAVRGRADVPRRNRRKERDHSLVSRRLGRVRRAGAGANADAVTNAQRKPVAVAVEFRVAGGAKALTRQQRFGVERTAAQRRAAVAPNEHESVVETNPQVFGSDGKARRTIRQIDVD